MNNLSELMQRHAGFGFSSQYVLAESQWNTVLSFHNYFDEIFPGQNIDTKLHLVFHDAAGRETAVHEIDVAPGNAVQIDCKALGVDRNGVVAMAAVPAADLTALAASKFKIKPRVTTGFYITWERDSRWRDTMHEWTEVSRNVPRRATQHVGFAVAGRPVVSGLVLTNPTVAPTPVGSASLTLRSVDGRMKPLRRPIEALPPMGSRQLLLTELFSDFEGQLTQYGRLVIDIESTQAAPPLTAEWHQSGDFHIHHI
jgi:hypothetical protein